MLEHSPARRVRLRPVGRRNAGVQMTGPILWVDKFDDPIALERALRDFFKERRPVSTDDRGHNYPETTALEVAQIAGILHEHSKRYTDKTKPSTMDLILGGPLVIAANYLGRDDDYADHRDAINRFDRYFKTITAEVKALPDAWAPYPGNATFWHEAARLVTRLGVAKDNPIVQESFAGAVVKSAKNLPETLNRTAAAISQAAMGPVRGLLKEIAIPVALGAGAIVGVVLLTRTRSSGERERAS